MTAIDCFLYLVFYIVAYNWGLRIVLLFVIETFD